MKKIEIDEELYQYITIHAQHIEESISNILRRMLNFYLIKNSSSSKILKKQIHKNTYNKFKSDMLLRLTSPQKNIFNKKFVTRFILILSILYQLDSKSFDKSIVDIKGRTRIYFSHDKNSLLNHGKKTNPKNIPVSPYWVITNTNTLRKKIIIEKIMIKMFFSMKTITYICKTFFN